MISFPSTNASLFEAFLGSKIAKAEGREEAGPITPINTPINTLPPNQPNWAQKSTPSKDNTFFGPTKFPGPKDI